MVPEKKQEIGRKIRDKILADYPDIYRKFGGDPMTNPMAWGFEIGDGWLPILACLSSRLDIIQKKYNIEIVAHQVKEKFGMLRFYYETITASREAEAEIFEANVWAEGESLVICEVCGERGSLRHEGWDHVACDDCESKRNARFSTLLQETNRRESPRPPTESRGCFSGGDFCDR